jgi:hypothetical protein
LRDCANFPYRVSTVTQQRVAVPPGASIFELPS